MKQFLRTVRQGRWLKYPDIDWLDDDGALQGDVFCDIQTTCCQLSVFRVNNDGDRQRVITALASKRNHVALLDYVIFDDSDLDSLGITVQQTEGDTPDTVANELHYELGGLTVARLVHLANIVSVGTHKRITKKEIKSGLQEAVKAGQLNTAKIDSEKMRVDLQLDT